MTIWVCECKCWECTYSYTLYILQCTFVHVAHIYLPHENECLLTLFQMKWTHVCAKWEQHKITCAIQITLELQRREEEKKSLLSHFGFIFFHFFLFCRYEYACVFASFLFLVKFCFCLLCFAFGAVTFILKWEFDKMFIYIHMWANGRAKNKPIYRICVPVPNLLKYKTGIFLGQHFDRIESHFSIFIIDLGLYRPRLFALQCHFN